MSSRHASQIAGDKSGERSIVSSIIEEEEEEDGGDDDVDYDSNSQSFTIQEGQNEDDDDDDAITNATNDDDLSETIYDENDHSTTYRSHYGTSLGPFSEDDGSIDDDLLLFDSNHSIENRNNNNHHHHSRRDHHRHRRRHRDDEDLNRRRGDEDDNDMEGDGDSARDDSGDSGDSGDDDNDGMDCGVNEGTQEEDENSNDEDGDDEQEDDGDDADDELNNRRRIDNAAILQEAENTLQELLEQFDDDDGDGDEENSDSRISNINISNEQYKEALLHLSTKWEQMYEQIAYENEQQFLAMAQERNDLVLEIDEMERRHRDELNIAKQEVMEQSQKIIMQEMKANADRERKSEGAIDKAVRDAIKETKEEMNEEFEIALGGMKDAQEEMQQRYEKLVKDTEIRTRHEVKEEADKEAEVKIHSFMDNYEEMKSQVVELTMELEKRDMGIMGSDDNEDAIDNSVIGAKDSEIQELKEELEEQSKHIQQLREAHQAEIETLEASVRRDKQLLSQKITIFEEAQKSEYEEMVKTEVQRAVQSTTIELNQKFEKKLAGAKNSTERDIELKYKNLVRDAEMKVRREVQDQAKSEANHKISAFMEDYEEIKMQIARMTEEKQQLESSSADEKKRVEMTLRLKDEEIGKLQDELASTLEKQQNDFDEKLRDTKNLHASQIAALKEQINTKNDDVEELQINLNSITSLSEEKVKEVQLLKDSHEAELTRLRAVIDNNEIKLSQRDAEHNESLAMVSKNVTEEIKKEYDEKIESLEFNQKKTFEEMRDSYEEKIESLRSEHKAELASLQNSNEKIQLELTKEREKAASTVSGRQDTIKSLMSAHETQLHELKASHTKEMGQIHDALDSIRAEKELLQDAHNKASDEFREAIQKMKEENLANVEKMKSKYREAKIELQAELSRASPKRRVREERRETIDSNTKEGLSINVSNSQDSDGDKFVLPEARTALSRSVKSGEDNKENSTELDSLASAMKSASTPPRSKIEHSFQDLSPLTLGSPSPQGKRTTKPRAGTPVTPPRVQKKKTNTERTTRARQTPDIPRSTGRTSQRASISGSGSKIQSPSSRTRMESRKSRLSGSSIPPPQAVSRRTEQTNSNKTFTRSGAASRMTTTSRSSTSSTSPAMRAIKIVDKTPAKKSTLSRVPTSGVIGSTKMRESNRAAQGETDIIRLMIINVPVSDKMKKMAKILRLELTNDPLEATHVIAGGNAHHIRRTAKLMAALCTTSNILKAEWLEDSYKKRSLLSCSHYLLLNDSRAENAYKFSMKQTLIEGKERRRDGGLFAGWKIMVCDEVAGNKAPKESDLRMMVEAAGGEWLLSSNVPVPVVDDPTHVIVITSDPALPSQIDDEKASVAAENGAGFFTTTWLFDCMMHQKLFGLRRGIGRL